MTQTLGVGFLGAGPVTQAIHLPTMALLADDFRVAAVMDVSAAVATAVADRVSARATTSQDDLIQDPTVDIVVVGSPNAFHAGQVEAACRAGKRAVLCEKPLAVTLEEASRIAQISAESGVPVIVGTMHTFDPGWTTLSARLADLTEDVHTVRSTIVMPQNPGTEDKATDIVGRPAPREGQEPPNDAAWEAEQVSNGVLGLAIHNLPHVRQFVPVIEEVTFARALSPWGYVITFVGAGKTAELVGLIHNQWRLSWTLDVIGDDTDIHVEFPPSYVNVGSARSALTVSGTSTVTEPDAANGYLVEWRAIADIVRGQRDAPDLQTLVDDVSYAITLADKARSLILEGSAA